MVCILTTYLVYSTLLLYEREGGREEVFLFLFVLDTRPDSLYEVTSYLPQLRKGYLARRPYTYFCNLYLVRKKEKSDWLEVHLGIIEKGS